MCQQLGDPEGEARQQDWDRYRKSRKVGMGDLGRGKGRAIKGEEWGEKLER